MLIEVRIGPEKVKINSVIKNIVKEARISSKKAPRVPHLTLFGPFDIKKGEAHKVVNSIKSVGMKYNYLPFIVDGFESNISDEGNRFVYLKIVPSIELCEFRESLSKELISIGVKGQEWDKLDSDFLFHITIANRLSKSEFDIIKRTIWGSHSLLEKIKSMIGITIEKKGKDFYFPINALRVTLLNNRRRISCEYDFTQSRLLNRSLALDPITWGHTLQTFRKMISIEDPIKINGKPPFIISDTHFDHENIIRYCARPFRAKNIDEMNNIMVENWNRIVGKNDSIYFLGDLSFGRGSKPASYWVKRLNGDIVFIKGCHDGEIDSMKSAVIRYEDRKFLLIHDPEDVPDDWDGWVIHGHKHNNDMRNYPFINGGSKRINVSAELINYSPISLVLINSFDLDTIEKVDSIADMRTRVSPKRNRHRGSPYFTGQLTKRASSRPQMK